MKTFYKLYSDVLKDKELTRTQQTILSVLINRGEYHKQAFYCYEDWIASEVDCSVRTVKRAIKEFEKLGYISINRTYNKETRKTTNYYTVLFDTTGSTAVAETNTSGIEIDSTPTVNEVKENDQSDILSNNNNNNSTVTETEVNDTTEPVTLIDKWKDACKRAYNYYFTTLMNGGIDEQIVRRIFNAKLQDTYTECINGGESEQELDIIRKRIGSVLKNKYDKLYNEQQKQIEIAKISA